VNTDESGWLGVFETIDMSHSTSPRSSDRVTDPIRLTMADLVCVIMPVYNAAAFLRDAIESVRRQTYRHWELLVIDDCSSDDTVKIVESMARSETRIRLIRLSCRSGCAAARNRAFAEARGEYVAFLDSDDRWLPEKLTRQIAFMKSTGSTFSFTAMWRDRSSVRRPSYVSGAPARLSYRALLKSNDIICSSVLLDRQLLGGSQMASIRKNEDFSLWLQLLKKTPHAHGLNEVCGVYTVRPKSVSSNKTVVALELWRVYRQCEKLGWWATLYCFGHFVFHWCRKRV
jgi:teichuronic acid biosynthesis glycosyltransferase TuaG